VSTGPATVADIAVRVDLLPKGTSSDVVDSVFHAHRRLNSVVIATDTDALLVGRRAFFQAMSGRLGYGRTLHYRRPVDEVVEPQPLRLHAEMPLEDAALEAARHLGRTGEDVLVAFPDGWGTVPAAALHHHLAAQVQARAAQLEQREARFRALVENSLDVILVLDRDARVLYHSRHTSGLLPTEVGDPGFVNVIDDDTAEVAVAFQRILRHGEQRLRGEFRVRNDTGTVTLFQYDATNLLDDPAVGGIVVNYRDITERRTLEDQLRRHALHDPLTGLANRTLLFERASYSLDRLSRVPGHVSVLYCDLDGFKQINDSLGHDLGDRVLVEAARRLSGATRRGDTLARFGGDEFVVLAEGCPPSDACALADRLVGAFSEPLDIDGTQIVLTASVGFVSSDAPAAASSLVKRADMAMYAAKLAGRNQTSQFSAASTDEAVRSRRLSGDLRVAIARAELELVYQPIFALCQGGMVGAEALLRWSHPSLGAISPTEFIPLAESDGLITRLGRWVISDACRTMARWRAAGTGPRWVAVNVSAHQLDDPEFADFVAKSLADHGLEPGHLHLELTETAIAVAVPSRLSRLAELRRLGLRIALDDFGTGYSSLSSVSHLPLDVVKIDRSFIAGCDATPEAAVILRGIIEIAHSLGYEVVAEGVERAEELRLLEEMSCDLVQGYLLGRAVSADTITESFRRAAGP
jgi:diguanylate cyclase (GGDEF)-like protein/PAS domain S-box-containing protein